MEVKRWAGRGCGPGRDPASALRASAEGFELGTSLESTRGGSNARSSELTFEGRSHVRVRVSSHHARLPGPTRYVALSVPLNSLLDEVRTEDGRAVLIAGARVTARFNAVHVKPGEEATDLSALPIHVRVDLDGHVPLSFETPVAQRKRPRTVWRSPSR